MIRAPSKTYQGGHCLTPFFFGRSAPLPAEGEPAIKDKVRDALRMARRISNRNGTSLRYTEQWETIDPGCIDDRF